MIKYIKFDWKNEKAVDISSYFQVCRQTASKWKINGIIPRKYSQKLIDLLVKGNNEYKLF